MNHKSDRIRFETWVEIEKVVLKKDVNDKHYYQLVTSHGTRFLTWVESIGISFQKEFEEIDVQKHLLRGFVNVTMGGMFLVVDEDKGTREQQIQASIQETIENYDKQEE